MKPQLLNCLSDIKHWKSVASGRATLKLACDRSRLCMNFDFGGGGGFVVARCELSRAIPESFVLKLKVRGRGGRQRLEVKMVDDTGLNVWRWMRDDFHMPARIRTLKLSNHDFEFAWGPAGAGALKRLGALEFAIVAVDGGEGSVWVSDLQLEDHDLRRAPHITRSTGAKRWLALDFHQPHEIAGLIVDWKNHAPNNGYRVQRSPDGKHWRTLRTVDQAGGSRSYVYLPRTLGRYLRVCWRDEAEVSHVQVCNAEFSRSLEAYWHNIAGRERRGAFPRWLLREQSFWTVVGRPEGAPCAIMNEEGMIELTPGSCSVEPCIDVDGELFTWADVKLESSLRAGWIPIPKVTWHTPEWSLEIEAEGYLRVTYRFTNQCARPRKVRLFAAIRPFQVTPTWQMHRGLGGVSQLHQLRWSDGTMFNKDDPILHSVDATDGFVISSDDGLLVDALKSPPSKTSVDDELGFASAALVFTFEVAPGDSRSVSWSTERMTLPWPDRAPMITAHGWSHDVLNTMRTATAHILSTRNGAALQPGPRRYTRSWIRDGTVMSAALLRMGHRDEVREFIRWYAGFIRADGFVPCCVDESGIDWLVEHDSHGQWLSLLADYIRFTSDHALSAELEPIIRSVASCIERLLESDGLLPVSVSHEGYLAQPVHSFWDDAWAVRGLRDAGTEWQALAQRMSDALLAAIDATCADTQLDYIPGSREWADFDPTATACMVTLLEIDTPVVHRTFDKYFHDWRRKRSGDLAWNNYTPYEIRIIGALVRLGRRDDALELLRFFLSDRRPLGWNQWPEIAWHEPRDAGHIGDVPHTWISAEYVMAVRSMFAFECERSQALVLAAGIAAEWMQGDGVDVRALPTAFGPLSYRLRCEGEILRCSINEGLKMPAGGIVLRLPMNKSISRVHINHSEVMVNAHGEIAVSLLPADIAIHC